MDRKGIIAVTLAIITLFAWTIYSQREAEKIAVLRRAAAAEEEQKKAAEQPPAIETPAQAATNVPPPATTEPVVPEKLETLAGTAVEFTFSNLGGGVARALLVNHEAERGKRNLLPVRTGH